MRPPPQEIYWTNPPPSSPMMESGISVASLQRDIQPCTDACSDLLLIPLAPSLNILSLSRAIRLAAYMSGWQDDTTDLSGFKRSETRLRNSPRPLLGGSRFFISR